MPWCVSASAPSWPNRRIAGRVKPKNRRGRFPWNIRQYKGIYRDIGRYIYIYIYIAVYLSIYLSAYLSIYISYIYVYIYIYIYISLCCLCITRYIPLQTISYLGVSEDRELTPQMCSLRWNMVINHWILECGTLFRGKTCFSAHHIVG